jgi:Uma2 family endonuclease
MILKEVVQELMQSPAFPNYLSEMERFMQSERRRRERFYDEMSESQKIEFINGEIIVQSPAKLRHTIASFNLAKLFSVYAEKHQLGHIGHEKLLVALTRNDYEPDISFWGRDKADSFMPDQMKFPAPELIVEVLSPSTEAIDRGIKFEDYAAHGVAEYWLVDPVEETVEQYVLHKGAYRLRVKVKDGLIDSLVIAGFKVLARAIFDRAEHLAALEAILTA